MYNLILPSPTYLQMLTNHKDSPVTPVHDSSLSLGLAAMAGTVTGTHTLSHSYIIALTRISSPAQDYLICSTGFKGDSFLKDFKQCFLFEEYSAPFLHKAHCTEKALNPTVSPL